LKQDVAKYKTLISAYQELTAKKQAQMNGADDQLKTALQAQIQSARQKQADAELALVDAQAAQAAAMQTAVV